jgi:hypothetical protein
MHCNRWLSPRGRRALQHLALFACAAALCVASAIASGPSWSWDRSHYHVYAAHQWVEGLLGRGYQPGGSQSFLNPLAYVPPHLLERAGWSARSVAAVIAAFQSLCVWAVWAIARDRIDGRALPLAVAAVALCTPVFVSQLGTRYIDASTAVFVLAGVWACRRAGDADRPVRAWAALGGLAMGVATGLKLSNAIPAALAPVLFVAAAGALRAPAAALRHAAGTLAAFALAAAIGLAAVHASWGASLHREFGNPFYPLFDSVFNPPQSVDRGTEPAAEAAEIGSGGRSTALLGTLASLARASGGRFVPESAHDGLVLPLRIADPRPDAAPAYLEWHAPDPRLAVLGVLLAAAAAVATVRAARRRVGGGADFERHTPGIDPPLLVFVLLWYGAWIYSSANGRYGLALLMLCSVPIVQSVRLLLGTGRASGYLLGTVVLLQASFAGIVLQRPDVAPDASWETASVRAELPASLRDRAWLHMPTTVFSWSYLLPLMHPDSTMANVYAGCPGERCDPRLLQVVQDWPGRQRMLAPVDALRDGRPVIGDVALQAHDAQFAALGMRVDVGACEFFQVRPSVVDAWLTESTSSGRSLRPSDWVASCPLVGAPGAGDAVRGIAARHDRMLQAIETHCAGVLGPARGLTRWLGGERWLREYPVRDMQIRIINGRVVVERMSRAARVLGTVDRLSAPGAQIDCEIVALRAGERVASFDGPRP